MSTESGTHGGTTTLVNTANGGGSLKRSNSETVTQGLMGPPVTRPALGMSLYRDEPVQQPPTRPAVARVPSGRQVLAERPTVAEVHVPEPAHESYHPGQADQQEQQPPPSFQPYHDENAYDSRAPYARPDGPLPPPPPSTSLPQQSGYRPVLAEVNRGYAQPQAPSTQQRTAAPLYGLQTAQKTGGEYQMPLRDRSPGLAEATPSATVQQGHYQSQQAYQQRQQQQMQHAPQYQQQQQPTQMQAPGVSFAPAPEQPTVERKMSKPIIVSGSNPFFSPRRHGSNPFFSPRRHGSLLLTCILIYRSTGGCITDSGFSVAAVRQKCTESRPSATISSRSSGSTLATTRNPGQALSTRSPSFGSSRASPRLSSWSTRRSRANTSSWFVGCRCVLCA